ncbi:MAG: CARDB domain-containing protein [Synechococcales bacterium]|nr:CARDB domain-containing protein [Synechococcales bacterium]
MSGTLNPLATHPLVAARALSLMDPAGGLMIPSDRTTGGSQLHLGAAAQLAVNQQPDLLGSHFSTSRANFNLTEGTSTSVQFQIQNAGATAGAFKVGFYLSADRTIDTTDLWLEERSFFDLKANQSSDRLTQTLSLPGLEHPFWRNGSGTYYLGMISDRENQIAESNELNNLNSEFGKDIIEINVAIPTIWKYEFTYFYNGTDNQADYYTGYTYDLSDRYRVDESVNVNSSANETGSNGRYLITRATQAGQLKDLQKVYVDRYFDRDASPNNHPGYGTVQFQRGQAAGDAGLGSEYDAIAPETASLAATPLSFGRDRWEYDAPAVDLLGQSLDTVNSTHFAGGNTTLRYQIRNAGSQAVGGLRVGFYLSQDAVIDRSDRLLDAVWLEGLAANTLSPEALKLIRLPDAGDSIWRGEGTYYLGMMVDWQNEVGESNETNNANLGNNLDLRAITVSLTPPAPVVRYDFTYYYSGDRNQTGEFYQGYVYAAQGRYRVNEYANPNTSVNELGTDGRYWITNATVAGTIADLGQVVITSYFNQENSKSYTPFVGAGSQYLGSETGYLISDRDSEARFGSDFYEADVPPEEFDPGNTIALAEQKTQSVFSRNQTVNSSDRDDFYRFTVSQSGIFTAALTDLTGDADVRLIADRNNNGQIDSGEILAWQWERQNNAESIRRFLTAGTYFLQVFSFNNSNADYRLATTFTPAIADDRSFDIVIDFRAGSEALSTVMRQAVEEAAVFWEQVISHSTFNSQHVLRIEVGGAVQEWDNGGGVLASAGWTTVERDATNRAMPIGGEALINTAPGAIQDLSSDVAFFRRVMIHEFGHVLGFGTLWDLFGRDWIDFDNDIYRANSAAGWAYGELLGTYQPTAIPITVGEGPGSDYSHWLESRFDRELMTHQADFGEMPLSALTIAALRDLGWEVNYGAAEFYRLPS